VTKQKSRTRSRGEGRSRGKGVGDILRVSGRLVEPFERAASHPSRASSPLCSVFPGASRALARLDFCKLGRAEPRGGSARLDSTPKSRGASNSLSPMLLLA
jgi:hypothetical protein